MSIVTLVGVSKLMSQGGHAQPFELIISQSASGRPLALLLNNSPRERSAWDPDISNRSITFVPLDKKRTVSYKIRTGVIEHPAFTPAITTLLPFTAIFAELDLASTFDLKGTKPGRYPYVCDYDDAAPNATAKSLGWTDAVTAVGRVRSNKFWIVVRPDHTLYISTDEIKR